MLESLTPALMALIPLALGYALGSIPFGLLLTRVAGLGDIRAIGSGNIGATNVLRTGNKGLAALTLALDALKGFGAVYLTQWLLPNHDAALAGMGAFLGHLYPVWLQFKGGKGVATFLGVLLAISPLVFAAFAGLWVCVAFLSRYSSLAALVASAGVVALQWLLVPDGRETLAITLMVLLLIYKHKPNIVRLLNGTESKIGALG